MDVINPTTPVAAKLLLVIGDAGGILARDFHEKGGGLQQVRKESRTIRGA
jgi:hypothetical protein